MTQHHGVGMFYLHLQHHEKFFHNVTPVLRFALLFSNMSMISFNYVENF